MHAYISLCLATGIRTDEARDLRGDHVDFGNPPARPSVRASAALSLPPGREAPWTRLTSGGSSRLPAGRQESGSAGHRGNCGTPSCR